MISKNIEEYINQHLSEEDSLLKKLFRETNIKVLNPRMLSGHFQGKLLEMFSKMINPKFILEIGTYTGYSAICLAKGLKKDGELHTIEINPELFDFARKYFIEAGHEFDIIQHTGSAIDIIPEINHKWDLVFIDADKDNYLNYFKLIVDKVRTDGFIIADNALWDGKVIKPGKSIDKETRGVIDFNEFVHHDSRVENILLPVRDGLMLMRKIEP